MERYYLNIADLNVCIESPWEIYFWKRMYPFMTGKMPDEEIDIRYVLESAEKKETDFEEGEEGKKRGRENVREYRLSVKESQIREGKAFKNSNILPQMRLENVLLEREGFFLHASLISWKGKGILFSAPSGTGKSTQAELWEKNEGAEIINEDRAVIRKKEEGYWAYGSMYAGTAETFKNEKVKVEAIFLIKQAPYNQISEPGTTEKFKRIYMETTLHPEDPEYMNRIVNILADVVLNVPIYQLDCTPTKEAVDTVKLFLTTAEKIPFEKTDEK